MRHFLLILCFFAAVALRAQLLPFLEQNRWGLCNRDGDRLTSDWDSIKTDGDVAALWRKDTIFLYNAIIKIYRINDIDTVRFLDSMVAVRKHRQWALLSKDSLALVVPHQYDSIGHEDGILVGISGKKADLLTPKGKYLMPSVAGKRAVGTTSGWVIWVVNDTLKGLLHPSGVEIPARYQRFRIMPPLIWACANGTDWYLYNDQGTLLHEQPFRYPVRPKNGYILNRMGEKWGVLNAQGQWLVPPEYDGIERYGDFARCSRQGAWEQHPLKPGDTRRALLIGAADEQSSVREMEYTTLLGPPLLPATADSMLLSKPETPFDERRINFAFPGEPPTIWYIRGTGVALVSRQITKNGAEKKQTVYGLYDYQHRRVMLPMVLQDVYYEDFTKSRTARCLTQEGKHIWITREGGVLLIPAKYTIEPDWLTPACVDCHMSSPHAHARTSRRPDSSLVYDPRPYQEKFSRSVAGGGRWGLLNSLGYWEVPPAYSAISRPNGAYAAIRLGRSYGFYSMETKRAIWLRFADIQAVDSMEDAFLCSDSLYQYRVVMPETGDTVTITGNAIGKPDMGLIPTREKGRWGLKTPKNTWLVRPEYDAIGRFSDGRVAVRKGMRWGYISRKGTLEIRCTYTVAGDFYRGRALVRNATRYGIIDTTGAWKTNPKYLTIKAIHDSLFIAGGNSRYGLFTLSGHTVISPSYRNLTLCGNWVQTFANGLYGYANLSGKVICPPRYHQLGPMSDSGAICVRGSHTARLMPNGTVKEDPALNANPEALKMPAQPLFQPVNTAWRQNERLLLTLYNARKSKPLVWNVFAVRKVGNGLFWVEGDGWGGYLHESGAWLFRPKGGGEEELPGE